MNPIDAVLIGGSAGSFKPLVEIISQLPAEFSASVFVAQHIEPTAHRTLVNLLQRNCRLSIKYPINEEFYLPSTIYVAPPGYHMLLSFQKIWVFPANFAYLPKPNIDLLFQSAAIEFKSRAIGIILSGVGSDGAIGLKAIKENGGVTIVQSEAEQEGMPNAAVSKDSIDFIIPSETIPSTINRIVSGK